MTSFQKINEVRFFFDLAKEYYNNHDETKCEYCLSAFLGAGFSLFDHTLEEYNVEFRLKLPRKQLKIEEFYETAVKQGNDKAVGFIRLFASEYLKIIRNPVAASMLTMRNINTHESTTLIPAGTFEGEERRIVDLYFLGILENFLPMFKEELVGWVKSKNYLFEMITELQLNVSALTDEELGQLYYDAVDQLTQEDVIHISKKYLKTLEDFVQAIRAIYPRF